MGLPSRFNEARSKSSVMGWTVSSSQWLRLLLNLFNYLSIYFID